VEQMAEIRESLISSMMFKNNLIISNIDFELRVIGVINRYENNFSDRKLRLSNSYGYVLLLFVFFNIIRYIYYILVSKDGKVPVSYLDTNQYIGGITQFHRLEILCVLISAFAIILLFNYSHHLQWREIIEILKGLRPIDRMKLFDQKSV